MTILTSTPVVVSCTAAQSTDETAEQQHRFFFFFEQDKGVVSEGPARAGQAISGGEYGPLLTL